MSHLFKSATKLVLVMFAITLSSAILYIVALNPHDHDMGVALHGLFANAMIGVISFYFGQKGLPTLKQDGIIQSTKKTDLDQAVHE